MCIRHVTTAAVVVLVLAVTRANARAQQSSSSSAARTAHADSLTSTRARKQAADLAARYPCHAQHDFDFWIGTFDATPWNQPNARPTGQLHNTAEYEGCVIVERWTGAASAGMSMSFYDVNRHAWRMVWNDDSNSSNDFEGSFRDGAMRFEGWVLDAKGDKMLASNVLQEVSPGVIRHIYSTSSDGGKTWTIRSDGRFVRRN